VSRVIHAVAVAVAGVWPLSTPGDKGMLRRLLIFAIMCHDGIEVVDAGSSR
jgi:hypothetical protein